MDLLATVRKEGSRGGRAEFQWSDVQNSSHREHYLGHSLMAPVGRWAKGRDLSWYAKADGATGDDEDPATRAARERKEEILRVKQAEEDALARALGLPVAPRSDANAEPVSNKREVDKVLQESAENDEPTTSGRGIGYGRNAAGAGDDVLEEKIEGNAEGQDKELQYALKEYQRRHKDSGRHDRDKDRHSHRPREEHRHRRHRSGERHRRRSREKRRSRSREERRRNHSRSRSPQRRREDHYRRRSRSRSR